MNSPVKLILAILACFVITSCAFDVETKWGNVKSTGKKVTVIQK